MKYLEAKVESQAPTSKDVVLLDGFFILHLIKEVPQTFGKISTKILQIVTNFGSNRMDIVFDRYFSPSIKNYKRDLRNNTDIPYNISGPDQSRPHDFTKELRNNYFKEALVKFLIEDWASDKKAPFIGDKVIHLNFNLCYRFESSGNQVKRTIDDDFTCEDHEEADTKIIFHLSKYKILPRWHNSQ
ncbi:fibropellin-1-like protein [Lasius niger]|uniref:Fibropellin-1-like protein n=1 Tax=Lasius niger TaxID=67767 RepID=A0A0J7K024_LASNI|nr:fibropellin-1-like protein [Lasius niger]